MDFAKATLEELLVFFAGLELLREGETYVGHARRASADGSLALFIHRHGHEGLHDGRLGYPVRVDPAERVFTLSDGRLEEGDIEDPSRLGARAAWLAGLLSGTAVDNELLFVAGTPQDFAAESALLTTDAARFSYWLLRHAALADEPRVREAMVAARYHDSPAARAAIQLAEALSASTPPKWFDARRKELLDEVRTGARAYESLGLPAAPGRASRALGLVEALSAGTGDQRALAEEAFNLPDGVEKRAAVRAFFDNYLTRYTTVWNAALLARAVEIANQLRDASFVPGLRAIQRTGRGGTRLVLVLARIDRSAVADEKRHSFIRLYLDPTDAEARTGAIGAFARYESASVIRPKEAAAIGEAALALAATRDPELIARILPFVRGEKLAGAAALGAAAEVKMFLDEEGLLHG